MASQELELGEYIGNQRRVQGIPVQFFCAQTGLAHATYTRLVRGEADWRLGPLLRAFDTLALSWEDVEVRVENTMMPLATTAQHIIGELGAIAPNALSLEAGEDLQKYLLVHVHELEPEAYQLLSGAIALYRQPDRAGQTRQASALLIKLRNYSQWTGFERNLFYLISPWLPFSAAHQALLSRIRPDGVTLQQIGRLYLSRATPLERAQALLWVASNDHNGSSANLLRTCALERRFARMALGKIGLQETPDGWPTFHRDLTLLYPDGALTTAYQDLWRAVQATDWRSLTEKPRIPCPPSNAAIDLNELRLNKKMSVATLCHGVGLSKATYWRLVRQETAQLPLSTVVRVFDWLHVRADELQSLYTEPIFIHERSFDGIGRVNEVLVAHISPRAQQHALLDLIAEYEAKAQAVPTPANHLVVTIAQFENAKLRVDYPQAQTLALSVLHQVLGIEDWNHFMNLALLVVADLLPIAPVVAAYTHVIKQVDAQAQLDDRLREILYMSLINASGLAENAAMQAEALTLLARATADKTTVMSRSIAKFTGLARARIASSSTAEADFLALKTTLVRFDPFLGHAVNISFDEMWTNLLPAD